MLPPSDDSSVGSVLHAAIAHLLEGVQVLSFDWTYLYLNATAAAHGRQEVRSLLGRTLLEAYPGVERTELFAVLQRVMRERQPERLLNEFTYPDGSLAWFELSIEPCPVGICVLSLDVSDRRTMELQLRQAQKLESLGRLASGMAHDFNNLLTAILGYSELLLAQSLPAVAQEDLREIHKAGERAARLTRQLLAFTRRQVIAHGIVNLNARVHEAQDMLERLLEDVRVEVQTDPVGEAVIGDATQIEQVLMNLAVNARDAMPGGGQLFIRTGPPAADTLTPDDTSEDFVALTVQDTGTGMPPDVLANATEAFFTTKPEGQGTGLGLSTVKDVARESGGRLVISSTLDVGTTVTVLLRRASTGAESDKGPQPVQPAAAATEKVLVVESDQVARQFMVKALRFCGYTVYEAASPSDALALAGQDLQFDVLIAEIVMPDVHGSHLAQRLVGHYPGLKVLYTHGGIDSDALATGALSAHVRVLKKPFTAATLVPVLRQLIDERDPAS